MPKRIATPPPGDDEPRYLTVVHPYAISGTCNMELPKDREDFARWVACCVDKDAFFAIYHKPKSRGMVIIEINRFYQHFDSVLGEHRWSEFLQNPTKEEAGKFTQVFYCTYSTGRIVQKNGWKRIDVDDGWFKAWSPRNRQIRFPYPATHFCDVPVEDQTNHSMCRPLPGAVITPPPVVATPQPVVGSTAWTEKKEGVPDPSTVTTQAKPPNAWAKGAPKANPTANGTAKKSFGIPQGTGARLPAVGGGTLAVKSSSVWHNPGRKTISSPMVQNWDESARASRQGTPLSSVASPVSDDQAPLAPPGLPARRNAWEIDVASHATLPPGLTYSSGTGSSAAQGAPDRAANFSAASWGSAAGASTSSPDSDSGPDLTTATESDNPGVVHIHFSESMEEEFHGMGIRAVEDEGALRELDAIAPGAWDEPNGAGAWETTAVGDWNDDALDAEDHWKQTTQPSESVSPILCNAHGVICKKGICAEYARQLRLAKWAEEAEKRKVVPGANKGKKGRSKGQGAGKNNEQDGGGGNGNKTAGSKTAQNNPFRGPGAPVRTNWRGAPRAIVSPDSIEKRETTKADGFDEWGNSDWEDAPSAAAVEPAANATESTSAGAVTTDAATTDVASNASWGMSENAYDPWATTQPQATTKANRPATGPGGGSSKKNLKPTQTKAPASSNWADQVDEELGTGARGAAPAPSVVSSKRGKKRGGTSTHTSTAKSSTSGWGSVANQDMPW